MRGEMPRCAGLETETPIMGFDAAYITPVLAAACAILGGIVWSQRARLRHSDRVVEGLVSTIDTILGQLHEMVAAHDFLAPRDKPTASSLHPENVDTPKPGRDRTARTPAGAARLVALRQRLDLVSGALRDTAAKLAETKRHMQRADKLATIGELTAGIAHEINNPLDGILSCVARLERDPANLAQNMEYLRLIHDALERMTSVIQRLLEYSQVHDLHLEAGDVHAVIENVVALIRMSARQNAVAVDFEFGEDVPLILGDKYYLGQALLNLALNALAATPEGGTIRFCTRTDGGQNGADRFVEVDVIDTGTGVDPAHMDRIFNPFFTTKDPGEGTGLGLAFVKSIIEDHQGRITVESCQGVGTTVRVFLPAADADPAWTATGKEID